MSTLLKYIRVLILLLVTFLTTFKGKAQPKQNFNAFSLEAQIGTSAALSHLQDSLNPKKITFFKPLLAGRYMFNPCFGMMVDGSFEYFKSNNATSSQNYFKTVDLRLSAQFVFNVGRALHFERFSPRFSILVHAGGGFSSLRDARTNWIKSWRNNTADEKLNLLAGITPQYKLTSRWVISGDVSYVTHWHQQYEFNFGPKILDPKKIQGSVFNAHIGVMYYFGKHKEHLDWIVCKKRLKSEPINRPKVNSGNNKGYDQDSDGIADSIDLCPDVAGLKEFGGCPKSEPIPECYMKEFPIILFDNSSAVISDYNKLRLDSLANCLKNNPDQKLIIHGYSDNIGDPISIEDIAYRRALNVKRTLTELGINKDRLLSISEGAKKPEINDSVYKSIGHNRIVYFEVISNNAYDIKELSNGVSLQKLFYTIQVGAYEHKFNPDKLAKYGRVLYSKSPNDKIARYSIGVYHSTQEAQKAMLEMQKDGLFPDAFVTAYYLGERLSDKRAKKIFRDKGEVILEKK